MKAQKTKELNLFEKICTCGQQYENCSIDPRECPEFIKHKKEVLTRWKFESKKRIKISQ
jgi:hypothetical protein